MDPSHDDEEEDGNEDEIVANSPPPTYKYDGSVDGFSSTWNPTRPIIEMKFRQVDCNNFQFLKKSTKMEKIVFLNLLLKPLKPRISGTQIHHYPLPLSLLGHMVVCISLGLYNRTTTEISVCGTNNFLNTF